MSAIYQGEVIELTSSDLQTLEQELNPSDDYQSLIVAKSAYNEPLEAHENDLYSEMEEYLLTLESRWEEPTNTKFPSSLFTRKEFTEEQMDAMWDESYRYGSDIEEQSENQYL